MTPLKFVHDCATKFDSRIDVDLTYILTSPLEAVALRKPQGPTYAVIVPDFLPFVTFGRFRPLRVFAAIDDNVLRLDSPLHHSLK
jgi:hypothetical protein